MFNKVLKIAIVGASGAVGEELLRIIEDYKIEAEIFPLASINSLGKTIEFNGKTLDLIVLDEEFFTKNKVDFAFFVAGGEISRQFAKIAVDSGAIVIDNTSYFRMDEGTPLIVPEVNIDEIKNNVTTPRIISNPNCSTIQMVQVIGPLHKQFGIKRIDVSTYQAVSGAGKKGIEELVVQMQDFFNFELENSIKKAFPYQIALNLIPQIDEFNMDNFYTKEELKMVNETNKILKSDIEISATCVRVPIMRSHSEAITMHFANDVALEDVIAVLEKAQNVVVVDDIKNKKYPMPLIATDTDFTYVGRIRHDINHKNIVHCFVVADQLRIGAALNAIRIMQKILDFSTTSGTTKEKK